MDRDHNHYQDPLIPPNATWHHYNARKLQLAPVHLDDRRRTTVDAAIRETSRIREWTLHALNVRTNHVHMVVGACSQPKRILSVLKANATRRMRESGVWVEGRSPWAAGGSRRYLWSEEAVFDAVAYVLDHQGVDLTPQNRER